MLGAGAVIEADVVRTTRPDDSSRALSEFGKDHISVRGYLTTVD